jgi:hypothetical protein
VLALPSPVSPVGLLRVVRRTIAGALTCICIFFGFAPLLLWGTGRLTAFVDPGRAIEISRLQAIGNGPPRELPAFTGAPGAMSYLSIQESLRVDFAAPHPVRAIQLIGPTQPLHLAGDQIVYWPNEQSTLGALTDFDIQGSEDGISFRVLRRVRLASSISAFPVVLAIKNAPVVRSLRLVPRRAYWRSTHWTLGNFAAFERR